MDGQWKAVEGRWKAGGRPAEGRGRFEAVLEPRMSRAFSLARGRGRKEFEGIRRNQAESDGIFTCRAFSSDSRARPRLSASALSRLRSSSISRASDTFDWAEPSTCRPANGVD